MESANLELARSLFEAWERGDFSSTEWAHPEIEFLIAGGPDEGSWTGLAGLAEGWRRFVSTWEGFRVEPEEYSELDAERVLVLARWRGHGKTSGVDIGQVGVRAAALLQIRGGKVIRLVAHWDRERALSDLGLAPKADSPRS
jgi:ketosteroid isomerase-like protein